MTVDFFAESVEKLSGSLRRGQTGVRLRLYNRCSSSSSMRAGSSSILRAVILLCLPDCKMSRKASARIHRRRTHAVYLHCVRYFSIFFNIFSQKSIIFKFSSSYNFKSHWEVQKLKKKNCRDSITILSIFTV